MDLLNYKVKDIISFIRNKKISARELCQFYIDRIEKFNPKLNAVLTLNPLSLKRAKEIDTYFHKYKDLPLVGIPILLKDVFCVQGLKTTAGSKILKNFISPYSAEVALQLEKAGAVILGKCNQDEFAMGVSNENSAFGPVLNPWDNNYVPGGSSGGSATSVVGGLCAMGVGTDTGGSIRQPASFCNLVGVKPTYGRVSRYGIIAYASSLDQAGPMTMYVEDSATLLEVLSGKDEKDSTSSAESVPKWSENLNKNCIKNMKIGWINKSRSEKSCSPETFKILQTVEELFKSQGGEVEEVDFPLMDQALPVYYLISTSEASSNLARYDGIRYGSRFDFQDKINNLQEFYSQTRSEGFGSEVKRRIIMGTYCLSSGYYDEYYNKASQIRRLIRDGILKIFSKYSLLIAPVSHSTAFKLGENPAGSLSSYLMDSFTVLANLAGVPALSIPAGFSNDLPVGVQLIAGPFKEQTLFDSALLIQDEIGASGQRPKNFRP